MSAKILHLGDGFTAAFSSAAELSPGRFTYRHCRCGHCPADYLYQRQERKEIQERHGIRLCTLVVRVPRRVYAACYLVDVDNIL